MINVLLVTGRGAIRWKIVGLLRLDIMVSSMERIDLKDASILTSLNLTNYQMVTVERTLDGIIT